MARTPQEIAFDLGLRLRARRHRLGLTQSGLARLAGVSSSTISRMELGQGGGVPIATWAAVGAALEDDAFAHPDEPAAAHVEALTTLVARGSWLPVAASDGYLCFDRPPRAHPGPFSTVLLPPERIVVRIVSPVTDVEVELDKVAAEVASVRSEVVGRTVSGCLVVVRTVASAQRLGRTRYRRSTVGWMRALRETDSTVPQVIGVVWMSNRATQLLPWSPRVA